MTAAVATKLKPKPRLSSNERRLNIIAAAVPLFANDGFRGVTTKMIAHEAGVSEALLYRHFPSKDAIYAAVQDQCCMPPAELKAVVEKLAPSTASLVVLLFFLAKAIVDEFGGWSTHEKVYPRLMLNSFLEDGAFARMHNTRIVGKLRKVMVRCFAAARSAGDLSQAPELSDELRFWFCHHLLVGLHMHLLPAEPVVDYASNREQLVDLGMRYMLRGIGLSSAAITRHYDYARLNVTVKAWVSGTAPAGES